MLDASGAVQAEPGSKLSFGRIIALKHQGEFLVGQPYLEVRPAYCEFEVRQ